MNWFKENKFLGGLLAVTALIAGLLVFLGFKTAASRDLVADDVAAQNDNMTEMKALDPYPTIESVAEKKANLKEVVAKAEAMQAKFLAFRPESLENITVSTFSDRLKQADTSVRAAFDEKDADMPNDAYLGFEQYKGSLPKDSATGILAYELSAIEWLFTELANAEVSKVVNFNRSVLPPEEGKKWDEKPPRRRATKGKSKRRSAPAAPTLPIAKRLPMDLTIQGSEESVRKAIEAIANSQKFFFETRIGRIKNYAPVPSSQGIKRAKIEEVEPDDDFGVVEGDDPAEEAASTFATQILQRVAGGNDVSAYIRLDLLLFDESLKFPAIK